MLVLGGSVLQRLAKPFRYLQLSTLALGVAYVVGSMGWCHQREAKPLLIASGAAEGNLKAGAGSVDLAPPYPVVIAGYPPRRLDAKRSQSPLRARALVLEVAKLRFGIVVLDLLTVPDSLAAEIREAVGDLDLAELWVTATHAHSSLGGYDRGLLAQLAGTGLYHSRVRGAVVQGAAAALERASASVRPCSLEVGDGRFPKLVSARSEGAEPDGRLTRMLFRQGQTPIAQWLLFAAHPTLVPRQTRELSPDYPGLFASAEEEAGRGVVLLVQGAVGNADAVVTTDNPQHAPSEFAESFSKASAQLSLAPVAPVRLAFSRVSTPLPCGDASRVAPAWLRGLGSNCLGLAAPKSAELSALQIGPLKLLSVPGEPTAGSASELQTASGADRVASLTNGYLGYVETPRLVQEGTGESKRQYLQPQLLAVLSRAGRLAIERLAPTYSR